MKNKKGFTLVELLAVIVILALIMGIAVVSIGGVLSQSRKDVIRESAAAYIDGVRKLLYVSNKTPEGSGTSYYGFTAAILESGGTSPYSGSFAYGTKGSDDEAIGDGKIWKYKNAPSACASATFSYITVTNGAYSICLKTSNSGDPYVDGSELDINAKSDAVIKNLAS